MHATTMHLQRFLADKPLAADGTGDLGCGAHAVDFLVRFGFGRTVPLRRLQLVEKRLLVVGLLNVQTWGEDVLEDVGTTVEDFDVFEFVLVGGTAAASTGTGFLVSCGDVDSTFLGTLEDFGAVGTFEGATSWGFSVAVEEETRGEVSG